MLRKEYCRAFVAAADFGAVDVVVAIVVAGAVVAVAVVVVIVAAVAALVVVLYDECSALYPERLFSFFRSYFLLFFRI